ncbi:MAG: fibronectin type III domain-containing protein [Candidatus Saccharibacteria bacterium]|nr:fibronectin type III domain-containing protein [Candidatus Saccharibacteria bacterium]
MRFCNGKFKKLLIGSMLLLMPFSVSAQASFQSSSYVIYENIHHTFDGPTITAGSATVSGTSVTVTWTTNVLADSFVVYSTDAGFATSKEQGTSAQNVTSHSVVLTGLTGDTTYYYKTKSTRINGGTTEGATGTFVSGPDATVTPPTTTTSGGGGIIVIDKNDKVAPIVSNVTLQLVDDNSVRVTWDTNEDATSFLEYGTTINYGHSYGQWEYVKTHTVLLENLLFGATYNFRVLSSDANGNVGYSENIIFNTRDGVVTEPGEEIPVEEIPAEAPTVFDFFKKILPDFTDKQRILEINTLDDLSNVIPIPILSGSPRIEIGPDQATIFWSTDRNAYSTVAIAPEDQYRAGAAEPYQQIVGNTENYVNEHEVTIYNLKPDTLYHYQLRSKSRFGPMISSRDFTFRTSLERLEITSFFVSIVDDQTAVFKWVTNKSADSAVRFSPYHGNVVAVDEQKIVKDNTQSVIHEIRVEDFQGGVFYQVELVSMDEEGNIASETLPKFSTSEEDLPPVISHIKTDSTVFVDRADKIQTIISWLTNEPSSSRVYYQEGVQAGETLLKESTALNNSFTKEHVVVISNFDPGKVYTFRVESIDSGGNTSMSKANTFMTAKKKESIITIILNILANTFSWVTKLLPQ